MNKKAIQPARTALKSFYGASLESDWLSNLKEHGRADRKLTRAESVLENTSRIGYEVHRLTISLVDKMSECSQAQLGDVRKYYVENRERLANGILDALEQTAD